MAWRTFWPKLPLILCGKLRLDKKKLCRSLKEGCFQNNDLFFEHAHRLECVNTKFQ